MVFKVHCGTTASWLIIIIILTFMEEEERYTPVNSVTRGHCGEDKFGTLEGLMAMVNVAGNEGILATQSQSSSRNRNFLWDIDYWNGFESMLNGILMNCGVVGVILGIMNVLCDLEKREDVLFCVDGLVALKGGVGSIC
eukprot:984711_1